MNLQHGEEWRSVVSKIEEAVLYEREANPEYDEEHPHDGQPDTVLSAAGLKAIRRAVVRAGKQWARSTYGAQVFRELWEFRDVLRAKNERIAELESEREELVCRAIHFGRITSFYGEPREVVAEKVFRTTIVGWDRDEAAAITRQFAIEKAKARAAAVEKEMRDT